ncbi:oxidoreductase [Aureococcus anophagefferens]|nr:oxidoreductase [Aureococcus anophagefferens]
MLLRPTASRCAPPLRAARGRAAMSGFEWVTYDEDAAPAPVYGPEPPDESFDDAEFEVALGGYSDGRKEEAERRRVDAVMAEARREGAKLQEFLKNPQAMRDHDARLAADAAEAAAVAHGATSDGDSSDDDLVEPPKTAPTAEDTARVDALIHQAEVPATPDQAGALRELTLATLLNRAARNKQDEWRLSLRATNRALKLDAANVKGLYRRAVALAGLGRHDDAEGDLNRVLAAAPENKDAQRKLLAVRAAAAAKKADQARVPRAAASAKHKPPREKLAIEVAIEAERAAMERDYDAANAAADAAHRALTPRDGNVAEEAPAPSPSSRLSPRALRHSGRGAAKAGGAPFDPSTSRPGRDEGPGGGGGGDAAAEPHDANDEWDAYFTPAPTTPKREKIVILGSGWAGLQALRKCAGPNKDIVVVSPRPHFLYTPLLAGSSVGTVALKSACEPLRDLVDRAAAVAASATFLRAEVRDVDVDGRTVLATTDDAAVDVSYDKLLASELADFRSSDVATRYGDGVASRVKIVLVEAMPRILAPFDASLAAVARDHLVSRGIEAAARRGVRGRRRRRLGAGIAARPVVARLCEKLGQATARGLEVDDRLRVKAAKGDAFGTVFALGDCALSGYAPTAQVAGQQGNSRAAAPAFYAWRGLHAAGKDGDERAVVGGPAFVLWRSLYFSQLLSAKTCFSVSSDWLKTLTSGRDAGAVEPIQRRATDAGLS